MGSCGNLNISKSIVGILIILSMYMLLGFVMGMYYTIIDRYLMNFTIFFYIILHIIHLDKIILQNNKIFHDFIEIS